METRIRLAGWAALAAGGVHLLQFAVLGIGGVLQEPEYPDPTHAGDNYWFGVAGTVTFALIALAYLVFFSAATAITARDGKTDRIWRTAMQSSAVIGITCWMLAGASNLARRGFNATAIDAASGGDAAIGRAVLQGGYLIVSTATIASAFAFDAWFIAFAIRGRRAAVIGWVGVMFSVLAALVPAAGWMANVGGIPMIIVSLLVLGPLLLRTARLRTADRTAVAPEPTVVGQ